MAFLPDHYFISFSQNGEHFSGAFFKNIHYGLGIVLNHVGF